MTRRQQGKLSGCMPRTIHYHELSQSALLVTYTHSHKVAGPIRQSHTILMGCGVDWCCDSNDSEADRRLQRGKSRAYWTLKIDRFEIVWGEDLLKADEKIDGVLSSSERKQSVVFIFFSSVFKQEKDLRFNKPWILSQRFIFRRNRYARRVGSGSTVPRRGRQLYEFSTKKAHPYPFISPLSVSFGLETCMMGVLAVLHILFRPEQEHKEKLARYTLHLQMIKSVFSSSQHLTHVCKNNICNLFSAHQNMSSNNV